MRRTASLLIGVVVIAWLALCAAWIWRITRADGLGPPGEGSRSRPAQQEAPRAPSAGSRLIPPTAGEPPGFGSWVSEAARHAPPERHVPAADELPPELPAEPPAPLPKRPRVVIPTDTRPSAATQAQLALGAAPAGIGFLTVSAETAQQLSGLGTGTGAGSTTPTTPTTPTAPAPTQPVSQALVSDPPRFRDYGIPIGDAVDVQAAGAVTFPLSFTLRFDPREPQVKEVPAELIQAFYFDERTRSWSTQGVRATSIRVSEGAVEVESSHLTVFRLGIPRGRAPRIHDVRPNHASAGSPVVMLGQGFSGPASQNVLTLGGAFVSVALDRAGAPQPMNLQDTGEVLILEDAAGVELDRAALEAAPAARSSWTREVDGDRASRFVAHPRGLFSPGTTVDGAAFRYVQGRALLPPRPGELVINEVLLAPPASFLGDANGDGETSAREDEFIELVNTTTHPLDLGGCALRASGGERHRFVPGTVLPGGMAFVIFGVDEVANPPRPAGLFGGRRVVPDRSTAIRAVARLPQDDAERQALTPPGVSWLTLTTFRQTSNPLTFQVLAPVLGPVPTFVDASSQLPSLTARQPRLLRVGDLDRDLDLDLVLVDQHGEPILLLNDGFGQFAEAAGQVEFPSDRNQTFDLGIGDLTGDGAPELVVGDTDPSGSYVQLILLENTGGAHFRTRSQTGELTSVASLGPAVMALGDLDGDADADAVVGMIGDQPLVFRYDGQGRFSHRPGIDVVPQAAVVAPTQLEPADVDQDGDLDLVLAAGRSGLGEFAALQLFLNDGAGIFTDVTADRVSPHHDGIDAMAVSDLDGDGDLDILAASQQTSARLYVNDGTGRFSDRAPVGLETLQARALALADLDGDGDQDLIAGHPPKDDIFLNNGSAAFSLLMTLPATRGDHRELAALDIDSDGDLDVVSAGPGVNLLLNTGRRVNRPPQLASLGEQTVIEGDLLRFDVQATDADGDPITLEASWRSGEPVSSLGASFTDRHDGTGTFRWTPAADQGARGGRLYELVVRALDGIATGELVVRILVHDFNRAPTLAPVAPVTAGELTPIVIQLQAQDPDAGDALTFGAVGLPVGATLGSASGLFQWTPGPRQGDGPGGKLEYPITFTATDLAGSSATRSTTLTVLDVNHAPVFSPVGAQQVREGEALTFVVQASDPDQEPVTIRASILPPGATFDPVTGQCRWTPDFFQARPDPYLAQFEATDARLTATLGVSITVLNVTRPTLEPIPDAVVREGELLQVAIKASDEDGDPLTVTVTPLPIGAQVVQSGSLFLLQWMPGMDQAGVYPLTVQVSDGTTTVTGAFTVTVLNHPGFQRLVGSVGWVSQDALPMQTPLGSFGDTRLVTVRSGDSLGLDLGPVHPAVVAAIELFHTASPVALVPADISLFVSGDNVTYQPYGGPMLFSVMGHRAILSGLRIPERFIKIHRPGGGTFENFLPQIARASGEIVLDQATTAMLEDLAHRTFNYFAEHVSPSGLIPDRVLMASGEPVAGSAYSTGATGFWLAALPIGVERGWITRAQGEAFARRTLERYLGTNGPAAAGQFGFFYHFLNADGTRFTQFDGDGVSILDSTLLFFGGLACGEYFGGEIKTLAETLYHRADWDAFYDHAMDMLRLFWTPEQGFIRHLDYTSEGILSYFLAAGSQTHPIAADPDLPGGPGDAYYAFSRGNFGRILGRYGTEGRPLLQTFFGSLFTYLYPSLLADLGGLRDAFHIQWSDNTREAILANFRFAQDHPEFGYGRLVWGISASDGPSGYQGLYGTPPLDPGAFGPHHDGTITPYALAGSLPFAADLALPALRHVAALQNGRLLDRYGLKDGVNLQQDFFGTDYLGIDQGCLLVGLEEYRTGLVAGLIRRSPVMQRAFSVLGLRVRSAHTLTLAGPRSAHAYVMLDTTDHLAQTIEIPQPSTAATGEVLLELHPYGMDNSQAERSVDVQLALNGQPLKTLRFLDRRGDGTVDVGSVYVPIDPARFDRSVNAAALTWAGGERWVQLEDAGLIGPTGRQGTQETWQIGTRDGAFAEFGDERLVDDSYVVGDAPGTFERALNVVDEPVTDILFELSDVGVDRRLRLWAAQTQDGRPVTVEVLVNNAVAHPGLALRTGEEGTIAISRALLREGWNHIALRHANVPADGEFIIWDAIALEREINTGSLQVIVRNVSDSQPAPEVHFGLAPASGAVLSARQYLEVNFSADASFDRITMATDNRNAPIHRFTGPADASAAGLVGKLDSTRTAPLLWQVYDDRQLVPPAFTNTTEWAFVPDASEPGFGTLEAVEFRTLISRNGLGPRPVVGRSGTSPIIVYLVADFVGKPAQAYGTDRLIIEQFAQ